MDIDKRKWLRLDEVAALHGVSNRTVERWIDAGLPAVRPMGGLILVDRGEIDTWLLAHPAVPAQPTAQTCEAAAREAA
jgi:excisionase family DNA binding protein